MRHFNSAYIYVKAGEQTIIQESFTAYPARGNKKNVATITYLSPSELHTNFEGVYLVYSDLLVDLLKSSKVTRLRKWKDHRTREGEEEAYEYFTIGCHNKLDMKLSDRDLIKTVQCDIDRKLVIGVKKGDTTPTCCNPTKVTRIKYAKIK